jgi:hypothetical protein
MPYIHEHGWHTKNSSHLRFWGAFFSADTTDTWSRGCGELQWRSAFRDSAMSPPHFYTYAAMGDWEGLDPWPHRSMTATALYYLRF